MPEIINIVSMISIVGKSKSGKTTLIEKLIPEIKGRGYRVGTIKHVSHDVEMDRKGKDSWRHKEAGADTVLIASDNRIALVRDEQYQSPVDLAKYFPEMDLVIAEGFKNTDQPKIEVLRKECRREPICMNDEKLVALVTDMDVDAGVPRFGLEDIKGLTDFIEKRFLATP